MHCVTQLRHPFLSSVNTLALNLSLDDPSRHFPTDCPAMVKKYQLVQVVTWWWCNHLVAGAASHLLVPPTEGVRDASFPLQNSPISKSEPTLLSHWLWSNYCCNAFMSFGNWIKLKAKVTPAASTCPRCRRCDTRIQVFVHIQLENICRHQICRPSTRHKCKSTGGQMQTQVQ